VFNLEIFRTIRDFANETVEHLKTNKERG